MDSYYWNFSESAFGHKDTPLKRRPVRRGRRRRNKVIISREEIAAASKVFFKNGGSVKRAEFGKREWLDETLL